MHAFCRVSYAILWYTRYDTGYGFSWFDPDLVIAHWITMNMPYPVPYPVWKCLPYGSTHPLYYSPIILHVALNCLSSMDHCIATHLFYLHHVRLFTFDLMWKNSINTLWVKSRLAVENVLKQRQKYESKTSNLYKYIIYVKLTISISCDIDNPKLITTGSDSFNTGRIKSS